MKAVKANKVYTISEPQKADFLAQGFDITDDSGNVIEHSRSSTVSREEYEKLLEENKRLKAKKGD